MAIQDTDILPVQRGTTAYQTPASALAAYVTATIPAATEAVAGKVELATAPEAVAGTDTTRAVHPAGLKAVVDAERITSNAQYVEVAGDTMTGNLTTPAVVVSSTTPAGNGVFRQNSATGGVAVAAADGTKIAGFDNSGPLNPRRLVFEGAAMVTTLAGALHLEAAGTLKSQIVNLTTTAAAANMVLATANDVIARSTSSARYKTDVEPADIKLSEKIVYESKPIWYRSTCDLDREDWSHWGFIAEDLGQLDPRLVHWDGEQAEGVQYERFVVHLVNVIQQQRKQLDDMEARLAALEASAGK